MTVWQKKGHLSFWSVWMKCVGTLRLNGFSAIMEKIPLPTRRLGFTETHASAQRERERDPHGGIESRLVTCDSWIHFGVFFFFSPHRQPLNLHHKLSNRSRLKIYKKSPKLSTLPISLCGVTGSLSRHNLPAPRRAKWLSSDWPKQSAPPPPAPPPPLKAVWRCTADWSERGWAQCAA